MFKRGYKSDTDGGRISTPSRARECHPWYLLLKHEGDNDQNENGKAGFRNHQTQENTGIVSARYDINPRKAGPLCRALYDNRPFSQSVPHIASRLTKQLPALATDVRCPGAYTGHPRLTLTATQRIRQEMAIVYIGRKQRWRSTFYIQHQ